MPKPISKSFQHDEPVADSGILIWSDASNVKPYWPELDGLRTVAFLSVFLCHYGVPPIGLPVVKYILEHCINKMYTGLDMLFVLSGFLITALLLDERKRTDGINLKKFFVRRSIRILPLYYIVIAFAALVPVFALPAADKGLLQTYFKKIILPASVFVANFAFIKHHDIVEHVSAACKIYVTALLFPLWSLCVEEHFYTLWAPLFKFLKSTLALKIACLTIVAISIISKLFFWERSVSAVGDWTRVYIYFYNSLCRMDGLMLGSLTAILLFNHAMPIRQFFVRYQRAIAISILGFFFWFCFFVPNLVVNDFVFLSGHILTPWILCLLLVLVITAEDLKRILSFKWLSAISKYTYAAYLCHYFVMNCVVDYIHRFSVLNGNMIGYAFGLITSLAITLILARVSWDLLEGRLAKLRKNFAS